MRFLLKDLWYAVFALALLLVLGFAFAGGILPGVFVLLATGFAAFLVAALRCITPVSNH